MCLDVAVRATAMALNAESAPAIRLANRVNILEIIAFHIVLVLCVGGRLQQTFDFDDTEN